MISIGDGLTPIPKLAWHKRGQAPRPTNIPTYHPESIFTNLHNCHFSNEKTNSHYIGADNSRYFQTRIDIDLNRMFYKGR